MSDILNNRMLQAACVVVPALCVLGSQFVGSVPSSAHAGESTKFTPPTQRVAFSYAPRSHETVTERAITSPFYFDSVERFDPIPEFVVPLEPRPRNTGSQALPPVNVSSILPHPKNPMAIIDGKLRRVGDMLDTGWKVMSINGDDFTVTLRHESGKEIRESMKKN